VKNRMDNTKVQYIIELLKQGDTKGAIDDLKGLNDQAGRTEAGMKELGRTAGEALATIGSALAVRAAIDGYVEYEKVVARLNGTLKATGQDSADFRAELKEQAKAFSEHSEETQKSIIGIQTLLIQFGAARKDLPQLTQAVLDLSAGMGIDAHTAALELGKALEGIDGPLKRIGITFDANAGRGEKFQSAIEQINERFGGLAQALANTNAGKLTEMEKAVGGLTNEFGKLALEALLPSIKYLTELAKATDAFLKDSPLAAEYLKELVEIVSVFGALTVAAKGFGLAWEFSAGGAIKQAGGLAAALKTIPNQIAVEIGLFAIAQVYRAVQEAIAASGARKGEAASVENLAQTNDRQRPLVESALHDAIDSGKIGKAIGDELLAGIARAFTPVSSGTRFDRLGHPIPGSTITTRDTTAEFTALSAGRSNALYANGLGAGAGDGGIASRLIASDQAKGVEELEKLTTKLNQESLEGFAKQRQAARDLFESRSSEIEDITRKQSLSSEQQAEVDKANEANILSFTTKMSAIDKAQEKQETDHAEKVATLRDKFLIEGLEGIDKEIALEKVRYDNEVNYINSLTEKHPGERAGLLSKAEDAHTSRVTEIGQAGSDARAAKNDVFDLNQEIISIGYNAERSFAGGFSNAFREFVQGAKSASAAFSEFAASFLENIAQMIMQALVLELIQSALGALGSAAGGGPAGDVGVGTGGGGGESIHGLGNIFGSSGRPPGISSIPSMALDVGRSPLVARQSASPGGQITVVLTPHPAYTAQIISNSIKGAQAQITQDVNTSTALRTAVKGVLT
jgi:hypothetical protein